jgi:hypothetical protein
LIEFILVRGTYIAGQCNNLGALKSHCNSLCNFEDYLDSTELLDKQTCNVVCTEMPAKRFSLNLGIYSCFSRYYALLFVPRFNMRTLEHFNTTIE